MPFHRDVPKVAAMLAAVPLLLLPAGPRDDGTSRLDAQQCNTRCQTDYTDCLDRCDGVKTCKDGCTRTVADCVATCSAPAPSASSSSERPRAAPSAAPPAASASPPRKKAPPPKPAKK